MTYDDHADGPLSDDTLRAAIDAAAAHVDRRRLAFKEAEGRLRGAERELDLLQDLGRLRGFEAEVDDEDEEMGRVDGDGSPGAGPLIRRAAPAGRDALVKAVVDVLRESGEPMPIRRLMAEVVARDAPIPGRGDQANLISVITRVPEITRPARGIYALAEWGLPEPPRANPPRLRAARRRRAKS